jgi:hypothetical protein
MPLILDLFLTGGVINFNLGILRVCCSLKTCNNKMDSDWMYLTQPVSLRDFAHSKHQMEVAVVCKPVNRALRRLRQVDHKFQAAVDCTVSSCHKTTTKNN